MARNCMTQPPIIGLAGTIAALALLGPATAQNADRLARADANGDGAIEWQELQDMRANGFERMDRNDDGYVDMDDRPGFGPGRSRFQNAFNEIKASSDTDGDGRITKTEMLDAPAPLFTVGDTNEDGILSAEEIAALPEGAGN